MHILILALAGMLTMVNSPVHAGETMRKLIEDMNGGPKTLRKMGKDGECAVHPNSYASLGLELIHSMSFSWANREHYEHDNCMVFVMGGGEIGFFGIVAGADGDAGMEIARVDEVDWGNDGLSLVSVRRLPVFNVRSRGMIYYIFPPTDPVRLVRWNKYRVIFTPLRAPGKNIVYFWRSIYLNHMISGAYNTVTGAFARHAIEKVFGRAETGNAIADSAINALVAGLFDYAMTNRADMTEWKTFMSFMSSYLASSRDGSADALQFMNNTATGVFQDMFRFYSQVAEGGRY